MKILGVYFREFDDGDYEIGILEDYSIYQLMDVGNFAYGYGHTYWPKSYKDAGWIRIGDF